MKKELETPSVALSEFPERDVAAIRTEYIEALIDTDALDDMVEAMDVYVARPELPTACLEVFSLLLDNVNLQREVAYALFDLGKHWIAT